MNTHEIYQDPSFVARLFVVGFAVESRLGGQAVQPVIFSGLPMGLHRPLGICT